MIVSEVLEFDINELKEFTVLHHRPEKPKA